MRVALLLLAAVLAAQPTVVLADGRDARGSESGVFVELSVLHATHETPEIDARVADLTELTKPPFSAYQRYRLLERVKLPLVEKVPVVRRLPNGRMLRTELLGRGSADTVRLVSSINQPGGGAFLPLLEVTARVGQRFIVAGQRYKTGILVLVLRIRR